MAVRVEETRRAVVVNEDEWPFGLDLRTGVALVRTPFGERRVRAQRWNEKRRLAQFASWGEEFVREQLWKMCVEPADEPVSAAEREAVLELAVWLSAGGRVREALPYDRQALAEATFTACRALGLAPDAFDALPAYEAEAMWRCAREERVEQPASASEEFTHRIVVLPEAGEALPSAPPSAVPAVERSADTRSPGLRAGVGSMDGLPLPSADLPASSQRASTPKLGESSEVASEVERSAVTPPSEFSVPLAPVASVASATAGLPAATKRTRGLSAVSRFRVVMGQLDTASAFAATSVNAAPGAAAASIGAQTDEIAPAEAPAGFAFAAADAKPQHFFWQLPSPRAAGAAVGARLAAQEAGPAAPASLPSGKPDFEEFAAELAERLEAAARELGIEQEL